MSLNSKFWLISEDITKWSIFRNFSKFWPFPDLAVSRPRGPRRRSGRQTQARAKLSRFGRFREPYRRKSKQQHSKHPQHGSRTLHRSTPPHRRDSCGGPVRAHDGAGDAPRLYAIPCRGGNSCRGARRGGERLRRNLRGTSGSPRGHRR